ncbi:MAG: SUMF1/EgtB/PvdO family nonheme iron enzyme [Chloroflexi bacterium SZAS-1]|nr:SUMF1/EgtB/PvdO family nonheme iron enzyme [Chloroflexi bacterium SZAS-1]
MSDDPETLQRQIAELQRQLAALQASTGPSVAGPVSAEHDVNIATNQWITVLGSLIYQAPPDARQREQLGRYLQRLAAKWQLLQLRGLDEQLDKGRGMALSHVFITMAIFSTTGMAFGDTEAVQDYFQDNDVSNSLNTANDPDWALPSSAVIKIERRNAESPGENGFDVFILYRSLLASETVNKNPYLILLGDPGSGKSTFMRHLAWALARHSLDQPEQAPTLFGWPTEERVLPLLLPLRKLSGKIATDGARPAVVSAALSAELASEYDVRDAATLVEQALNSQATLLLLDGLDEVPLVATTQSASRAATVQAVRAFAQLYPEVRIVLTCRTRAFDESLRAELGWNWHAETLAPFTLGQVRHFAAAWYAELAHCGQLDQAQSTQLEQRLVETIVASPKLQDMAGTPLLLTMMALILYNKGELPRDRPELYKRLNELLLGQWDKVREGQSLAEAIGMPDWTSERIMPLLDRLSYEAHADVTSTDGRGRLDRGKLFLALRDFFKQAKAEHPGDAADRCLDYIEHRSGLLAPDGPDSYVFVHLTLQEHCAGRHLALSRNAAERIMEHRADDRWREPILLGLGAVQPSNPWLIESVLRRLIGGTGKEAARWQRDLIFATEIGQDRDWKVLAEQGVDVPGLQADLRAGLVALLNDDSQPLPVAERVRAGFLLGNLGDPRFPITLEDWRRELAKVRAGNTSGYFCRVEAGTYIIGSADGDPDARDEEKPQHTVTFDAPFWIARYPMTNVQWQEWVMQTNGKASYYASDTDLNHPNQPVVGIDWDMGNTFCAWLSQGTREEVHLPTEQEWEAAARGMYARRYSWGDEWQDDRAATEEDRDRRGWQWSVPVGCYPAGAAPCGALDMAGNVWEWTTTTWRSYPGAKEPFTDEERVVLRGGDYINIRTNVRCGARGWDSPHYWILNYGFRIVVAARSH